MTARVALVTGGTGGIGTAIVKRLASLGHKVATNYRDEAKAKTLYRRAADLDHAGSCHALACMLFNAARDTPANGEPAASV